MADSSALIGDAIRAKLAAELTGWTVVRRKAPSLPPKSTLPVAVVCVAEEGDIEHLTGGDTPWDMATYPTSVSLYFATDGEKLADSATVRTTRRLVRGWLNAPATYAGVEGFCETIGGGKAVFGAAAHSVNQNESVLTARIQVLEARGN